MSSLHVTASEGDLAFLKQEIIGCRSSYRSVAGAGDGLLYNLTFEDAPTNSCEIDAKERLFVRYYPAFDEIVALVVSPKIEVSEPQRFCQGLNPLVNDIYEFVE